MVTAWVRRYEVKTQLKRSKPPSRPTIVGIAVATIVPSIAAMNIVAIVAARTQGRRVRRVERPTNYAISGRRRIGRRQEPTVLQEGVDAGLAAAERPVKLHRVAAV